MYFAIVWTCSMDREIEMVIKFYGEYSEVACVEC